MTSFFLLKSLPELATFQEWAPEKCESRQLVGLWLLKHLELKDHLMDPMKGHGSNDTYKPGNLHKMSLTCSWQFLMETFDLPKFHTWFPKPGQVMWVTSFFLNLESFVVVLKTASMCEFPWTKRKKKKRLIGSNCLNSWNLKKKKKRIIQEDNGTWLMGKQTPNTCYLNYPVLKSGNCVKLRRNCPERKNEGYPENKFKGFIFSNCQFV